MTTTTTVQILTRRLPVLQQRVWRRIGGLLVGGREGEGPTPHQQHCCGSITHTSSQVVTSEEEDAVGPLLQVVDKVDVVSRIGWQAAGAALVGLMIELTRSIRTKSRQSGIVPATAPCQTALYSYCDNDDGGRDSPVGGG